MKAEIVNKPKGFTPVTVQITFEKEVELTLFKSLMLANLRIPDLLLADEEISSYEYNTLIDIMGYTYKVLSETKTN